MKTRSADEGWSYNFVSNGTDMGGYLDLVYVPEPASGSLLLLGGLAVLGLRRQRK